MSQFLVAEGASFPLQQNGNAVTHRVGQARAAGGEFLLLAIVFQGPLGNGANQQFKQSCVHARMIAANAVAS